MSARGNLVAALLAVAGIVGALALGGCVIDIPIGNLRPAPIPNLPTPPNGPIDVLLVVDNSGSMTEEQAALAASFWKASCPIQDLLNVPEQLQNPAPDKLDELFDVCGFTQLLAAFGRDFRVGVITTDVNACDNAFPDGQGGLEWGFRPQRGCLQPLPSTGARFLTRDEIQNEGNFDELAQMMNAVGTFGSPYERGFDAVDKFLAGETFAPECEGDSASFLRREAQLLIVFVTDEDDCSHGDGVGGYDDETQADCGEHLELFTEHNPNVCYEAKDTLVAVEHYAERFRAFKGAGREQDVRVLVVGGAVEVVEETFVAGGCYPDLVGNTEATCFESYGLSNANGPGQPCSPDDPNDPGDPYDVLRDGLPCCTADGAGRYAALADFMDMRLDTICRADFAEPIMRALE